MGVSLLSIKRATTELWPLPEHVGEWGNEDDFRRQRHESGQWVFWQDRFDQVLAGRYQDVLPLHVELSPTFLCNFSCPWCSCRSAREEWSEDDVFRHPRSTPLTVMRKPRLESVIDHLAEHGVEVMWVGGEPTMNPLLYAAATRAHQLGVNQCIFTNGSLFRPDQAASLFDSEFVFVRVSLNAVTTEVHQRHHDYDPRRPHAERVLSNLALLAQLRAEGRSRTLVGVSIVVDRGNVDDLIPTARFLGDLCTGSQSGKIDYVIMRPAFPLVGAQIDVDQATVDAFRRETAPDSQTRRILRNAGIDVIVPNASVAAVEAIPEDDLGCLAAGWFGEVTPSGDMLPCSDLYGDPAFYIGNVATDSLKDIWASATRRSVLDQVRTQHCPSKRCPANGRGHHLNRVFRQVESLRQAGRLDEVLSWAERLREVLPVPEHSFFL
jgi:radical SAM protein with 4Fe4S-binding SPASM domain